MAKELNVSEPQTPKQVGSELQSLAEKTFGYIGFMLLLTSNICEKT